MAYTVAELAQHWNCHPKTIRRLIRARRLRAFQVGREWRIPASCVKQYEAQYQR
jgi:excisionase family DNA binding protein